MLPVPLMRTGHNASRLIDTALEHYSFRRIDAALVARDGCSYLKSTAMSPSRVGALLLDRSARADADVRGDGIDRSARADADVRGDGIGVRETGRDSVRSTTPADDGDGLSTLALLLAPGLRRIEAARTAREGY